MKGSAIVAGAPPLEPRLVLLASVLAISWAAPLIRLTDAHPISISFWRLALALPLIAALIGLRSEWGGLTTIRRRHWSVAALAGVFLAAHFAAWVASVQLTTVAAAVTLVATQPVWVAIIARLALREDPGRAGWIAIVLALLGSVVIGWGDFGAGRMALLGDALAVLGALCVAVYYVLGRGIRAGIPVWPYVGVVYGFATLTLLVAAIAADVPLLTGLTRTDWAVFGGLAVGPMLIGHTGQNYALAYLPAHAVNLTLLGEPLGATLIAWLLPAIRETPPLTAVAGGALILSGIVLGMWRRA